MPSLMCKSLYLLIYISSTLKAWGTDQPQAHKLMASFQQSLFELPFPENVAYSKPTFQSSTLRSLDTMYVGSKAVDADTAWPACSHSAREQNPFWTVDLVLPTAVYDAKIVNRNDCCRSSDKSLTCKCRNDRFAVTGCDAYAFQT